MAGFENGFVASTTNMISACKSTEPLLDACIGVSGARPGSAWPAAMLREGMETLRTLGSEDFRTYFLSLLASTLAKAGEIGSALEATGEALSAAEQSGERFYLAELHRQHGELLLAAGHDRVAADSCFESAAEIARRQGAHALADRARRALDPDRV